MSNSVDVTKGGASCGRHGRAGQGVCVGCGCVIGVADGSVTISSGGGIPIGVDLWLVHMVFTHCASFLIKILWPVRLSSPVGTLVIKAWVYEKKGGHGAGRKTTAQRPSVVFKFRLRAPPRKVPLNLAIALAAIFPSSVRIVR